MLLFSHTIVKWQAEKAIDYIFCNRATPNVDIINIDDGNQSTLFSGNVSVNDPIDIIVGSSQIYVLDAHNGEILVLNLMMKKNQ